MKFMSSYKLWSIVISSILVLPRHISMIFSSCMNFSKVTLVVWMRWLMTNVISDRFFWTEETKLFSAKNFFRTGELGLGDSGGYRFSSETFATDMTFVKRGMNAFLMHPLSVW